GAFGLTLLFELLRGATGLQEILSGLFLVVFVLLLPRGIVGELAGRGWGPREKLYAESAGRRPRGWRGAAPARRDPDPLGSDADGGATVLAVGWISRRFGGLWALRDVTLDVSRGEIHGLIGPNGAGKTTLLNVISGVMAPSSGVVEVAGSTVSGLRSHAVAA